MARRTKPIRNEDGRLSLLALEGKRIARIVCNTKTARLNRYQALDAKGQTIFSFDAYSLFDADGMLYHNENVSERGA